MWQTERETSATTTSRSRAKQSFHTVILVRKSFGWQCAVECFKSRKPCNRPCKKPVVATSTREKDVTFKIFVHTERQRENYQNCESNLIIVCKRLVFICLGGGICKIVSRVVKLLCIFMWIEAHGCESSKVTHKSSDTFVKLSFGWWIILYTFATLLKTISLHTSPPNPRYLHSFIHVSNMETETHKLDQDKWRINRDMTGVRDKTDFHMSRWGQTQKEPWIRKTNTETLKRSELKTKPHKA